MNDVTSTRDLYRLLGGLMLEGANPALLSEFLVHRSASRLGDALGGDLSVTLSAIEEALGREGIPAAAAEYTRLTVADGRGARRPVPVPLWEDVHLGGERRVHGERSRQVGRAYPGRRARPRRDPARSRGPRRAGIPLRGGAPRRGAPRTAGLERTSGLRDNPPGTVRGGCRVGAPACRQGRGVARGREVDRPGALRPGG